MSETKELIEAINSLKESIDELRGQVSTHIARMEDAAHNDPHDMMRELNGSLHELTKTLETTKFK
ncbi:MAG: hypothetical protein ABFC94_18350 [Syntrophomonas sp.]